MPAPTFRAAASAVSTSGTTSLVLTVPSAVQVGDLLVVHGAGRVEDWTTPSGWNVALASVKGQVNTMWSSTVVFWRIADSADADEGTPATHAFTHPTTDICAAIMVAYTGVDPDTPFAATGRANTPTQTESYSTPVVDASAVDVPTRVLHFWTFGGFDPRPGQIEGPVALDNLVSAPAATTSWAHSAFGDEELSVAGNTTARLGDNLSDAATGNMYATVLVLTPSAPGPVDVTGAAAAGGSHVPAGTPPLPVDVTGAAAAGESGAPVGTTETVVLGAAAAGAGASPAGVPDTPGAGLVVVGAAAHGAGHAPAGTTALDLRPGLWTSDLSQAWGFGLDAAIAISVEAAVVPVENGAVIHRVSETYPAPVISDGRPLSDMFSDLFEDLY